MSCKINLSKILDGVERNNIGLYELDFMGGGGLMSFRMMTILTSFRNIRISVYVSEKSKVYVKAPMACYPRCLRCK